MVFDAQNSTHKGCQITIGRAAEMVGIPLREMMEYAAKQGIPFQYSMENLEEDIKAVERDSE